jgi:hypothetical protein
MKRIFLISMLMLTALITAQNQNWTGTKNFGPTLKFVNVSRNDTVKKVLALDITGKPVWRSAQSLRGLQGIQGPQGIQGVQGPIGLTGPQGLPGTSGSALVAVSATQTGLVNNLPLQELGGADKLINGVRIGQGNLANQESTVLGVNALMNDTGGYHTAIGFETLKSNTSGIVNDAFGDLALTSNTSGSYNTAIGAGTLQLTLGGFGNCAVGGFSMYNLKGIGSSQSSIGSRNTAVGGLSMFNATTGAFNTAIGSECLNQLTTGYQNVAIGANVGLGTTTGFGNTFLGASINGNVSNTVVIGANKTPRITVDFNGKTNLLGRLNAVIPIYTNDAAADADAGLASGDFYKLTGSRQIFQKP